MNAAASIPKHLNRRDEGFGWIAGTGFTVFLFFALAHFEYIRSDEPATEIEDVRAYALPSDPPPPDPKIVEPPPAEPVIGFSGIDIAESDSPIRITVVPPDLEKLIPTSSEPPKAGIQYAYLPAELKPGFRVDVDVHRIYQAAEVDQQPKAITRVAPPVPKSLFGDSNSLRVNLLLLIDESGHVVSARVVESSGQQQFDQIVAQTVKERWEFSPAIKRGKRVKCLAEQAFRVNLGGGSPFTVR